MMRRLTVTNYVSQLSHPDRGFLIFIEPRVDDTFVVRINRAEDTGKNLEGEFIPEPELDPKTSRTEVRQHKLTEIFSGYANLFFQILIPYPIP